MLPCRHHMCVTYNSGILLNSYSMAHDSALASTCLTLSIAIASSWCWDAEDFSSLFKIITAVSSMQEQHDVEAPFLTHDGEEGLSDSPLTRTSSSALLQGKRWLQRASSSFAYRKAVKVNPSSAEA